ncbi:MAG: photosystem II reaction center PsbP family protein [Gemmatimonadaceae bacterium]|nr:photosystem II reaction center PsbP family protein [Gloeobacterales cyanobacterium ES-bin-141]
MKLTVRSIALVLALILVACGRGGIDAPEGFTRYRDTTRGYTLVHPDTWVYQPDPKGGILLSDPADPSYQVTVVVSDAPRKDIKDITAFGTPKQVAERFVNEVLKKKAPPTALVEMVNPAQRKDAQERPYYSFEVILAQDGKARHLVYCLNVSKGKVYTLVTGTSDTAWSARRERIYEIANSFVVS